MRRRLTALALVLPIVATTGCADSAQSPKSSGGHATTQVSPTPQSVLTPSASASSPLGAGERVFAAFSQRGLTQHAWWAKLKPMLSDSAQATYVYVDPKNIPDMKMKGKAHLAKKSPGPREFTSEVIVPTSVGTFRLDLERHTHNSPWLLYAISFPKGVQ